ncbi:hypothetical protein QJS66_15995 [Kocuria rhizophila]|nr:hypothetical protein QJS66_15995 [Kocuria rhizophila]
MARALWASWDEDAVTADPEGQWADPSKLHRLTTRAAHFPGGQTPRRSRAPRRASRCPGRCVRPGKALAGDFAEGSMPSPISLPPPRSTTPRSRRRSPGPGAIRSPWP